MPRNQSDINQITIHNLQKPLTIEAKNFPVSQETLFLIDFVISNIDQYKRAVDLGTGTGLIALAIGANRPESNILGIDIQSELIATAQNNCIRNKLKKTVNFKCADLKNPDNLPPHNSVDLVVANPPFRKLKSGKISPSSEISRSCHEMSAELKDYIYAASLMLRHHGYFAVVMLPDRFLELTTLMQTRHIEPCVTRFVHHFDHHSANAVLMIGRKNGNPSLTILPPLIVKAEKM